MPARNTVRRPFRYVVSWGGKNCLREFAVAMTTCPRAASSATDVLDSRPLVALVQQESPVCIVVLYLVSSRISCKYLHRNDLAPFESSRTPIAHLFGVAQFRRAGANVHITAWGKNLIMRAGSRSLRDVMGRFATGVTVIAATDPLSGARKGLTANAVCSVSLDPPLILVCVSKHGRTHDVITRAGHFSVNVLAEGQLNACEAFASAGSADKFESVPHHVGCTGAPLISGSLASLECELWTEYPGGDHTIFVGRVLSAVGNEDCGRPLVFYRGKYTSVKHRSVSRTKPGETRP